MRNLRYTIIYMNTNILQDFHICIGVPLSRVLFHHKALRDCRQISILILSELSKLREFYSPWSHLKTIGFLMISGGIEVT